MANRLYLKFLLIFVFLLNNSLVFSQNNNLPAYTLQFALNYNRPVFELSGNDFISENIYDGKTFGAGKGFGASIISKIRAASRSNFIFTQSLSYNRMLSYNFSENQYDPGEAYYNAYTLSAGIEFSFTPKKKINISAGAELNASFINGDSKIWFQRIGHPLGDSIASYVFTGSFRIGYGLSIGAEYIVNNKFGLTSGINFKNINAFNKNAEGKNEDKEFPMRDDNSNDLIFAGNKNFAFFSVNIGVSIYFGLNDGKVK